jgi:anti-anti-sigma factor
LALGEDLVEADTADRSRNEDRNLSRLLTLGSSSRFDQEVISMSDSVSPSPRAGYRAGVAEPSVEVVRHTARVSVVEFVGEHDLSTKGAVLDALAHAAAQPSVVVDFSRCTFVDSSVISVLVALHGTAICTVRLVVPDGQRIVRRTFEMVQMDRFFAVHDCLERALLAAEADDAVARGLAKEVAS